MIASHIIRQIYLSGEGEPFQKRRCSSYICIFKHFASSLPVSVGLALKGTTSFGSTPDAPARTGYSTLLSQQASHLSLLYARPHFVTVALRAAPPVGAGVRVKVRIRSAYTP